MANRMQHFTFGQVLCEIQGVAVCTIRAIREDMTGLACLYNHTGHQLCGRPCEGIDVAVGDGDWPIHAVHGTLLFVPFALFRDFDG